MNTDTVTPCQDEEARWFFDRAVDNPRDGMSIAIAKQYCDGCPLRTPCLSFALKAGGQGVYGGVMFSKPVEVWECRRGHDLTLPGATRNRSAGGGHICRACDALNRKKWAESR